MSSSIFRKSIGLLALLPVLLIAPASAQEEEAAPESEQPQGPLRIRFMERPVAIEPEVDPQLPEIVSSDLAIDPEADPEFVRRMNSIREYSEIVESIEESGGVWASGLSEQLASIGELEQQQDNHPGAIAAFDRSIHISRISNGLHTLDQIPMLESMIDSYLVLGDWEQVDLYNNYLFFVQQKAYGSEDPRIIPVLDRLATWNMQAFNLGYGESLAVRLSSAQLLFRAAARLVGRHFGRDDERFVRYLRNLAISSYQVARYPEYRSEVDRPEFRGTQELLADRLNQGGSILPQGYGLGEAALRGIIEYYEQNSQDVYSIAEVITHLGDWHLLFDRRRSADFYYLRAWEMLAAEENAEELVQKLFGQVTLIPTYVQEPRNLNIHVNSASIETFNFDYADVELDVTALGQARSIEVLSEETQENKLMLSRLRREVRSSRFRPILEGGVPIRSGRHQFRYRYWY